MQFPSSTSSRSRQRPWLGVVMVATLMLIGCRDKAPVILTQVNAFDARIDVNLVGVTPDQARQATALIAQDFAFLEQDWSSRDSGALRRVNQRLGRQEPFVAPPSLLPLLRRCKTYERQSDGLFNPAIGRLMDLWGFRSDHPSDHAPPTGESIARLVAAAPSLNAIAIQGLELRGEGPALALDLSAIARGAAIDIAMEHLMDLGVRNALIQSDTEVRAIGERSGQPWRIPIRRANGSGVLAILSIRGDESVVTRAAYGRHFIYKGRQYHDILDPRTGRPADQSRAVTVVAQSVADAAAAASALFVAGPDAWLRIAARMGIQEAVLIDAEGRVRMTKAMADRIELFDAGEEVLIARGMPHAEAP